MFEKIYIGDTLIESIYFGAIGIQYGNDGPPVLRFITNINNNGGYYDKGNL